MMFKNTFPRLAASAALIFAATTAQAALLNYTFDVTLDISGAVYSGSLSFDNDPMGASPGSFGEQLFALSSFSFDFIDAAGAKSYTLADLASADAAVQGGVFVGIDADDLGGLFQFLSGLPAGPANFAYTLPTGAFDTGVVSFTLVPDPLPVPASGWLLAAALGALAVSRRRRDAR